jgi:glutaredoxin 3
MKLIEIYTEDFCPYCLKAKSLLDIKGLRYQEIKIKTDEARQELIKLSNRKTVPQIFIEGKHIGGCDDLYHIYETGELDTILNN